MKERLSTRPEYTVWMNMKAACQNPNAYGWRYHGAQGRRLAPAWQTFARFFKDMGPRPSSFYRLLRRDPQGDFTPENCFWGLRQPGDQSLGTVVPLTWKGETHSLWKWSQITGIHYSTLLSRHKAGKSAEEILAPTRFSRPLSAAPTLSVPISGARGVGGRTWRKEHD